MTAASIGCGWCLADPQRHCAKPTSVIPAGRAGTPMEIAEGICWLLSDAASYVAGENMRIAGGRP